MPGLQDLAFEILEYICELVAGPQPRKLIPFSEVSKKCLAASSQSLWEIIPLRITRQDQIPQAVEQLKHILQNRLGRDGRVRCVSIRGRKPLDYQGSRQSKIKRLERAYLDNIAWQPLADVLAGMPPLSDMEWEKDELPPCIFRSLISHHHNCRLRIVGVKRHVDKSLDPDEQPAATSSFMYELLLPLNKDYDFCSESPHEFDLVMRSTGPPAHYRAAALSTLELTDAHASGHTSGSWVVIGDEHIVMWNKLTHLPALRILKSELKVHASALMWFTVNPSLVSLKTLDIKLQSESMLRRPEALGDLLHSLPPLENLALTGEINPAQSQEWILSHASSLKRLQLKTMEHSNKTFDLVSLSPMVQPLLPLLEHLSITIKRSKGDSDEVSIYKILGATPKLQSIVLGLDCSERSVATSPHHLLEPEGSDTDFWQRTWTVSTNIHDRHPGYPNI
ncbi:unnamed protein product [Aureobasidium vineae]|uniref:Uncharacterized protein n=1 Tax=Aureobasidium vineae TaxID=2773715 RepID=A0A9N8JCZ3_9PEZI|nr:unnamed protein product [Aureobasidium vineae]